MLRIASRHFAFLAFSAFSALPAQQGFTSAFTPAEFAARRARIMAKIGDGVAILQGTTERRGESPLRQSNQFFYLTGVTEPRPIVLLDGRTKTTTLYLQPKTAGRERAIGPYLGADTTTERVTGIERVMPRDSFATALQRLAAEKRIVYTPFRPEVLGSESASDVQGHMRATKNDPWDGRDSREDAFIARLKVAAPTWEVRNLDPMIDSLRAVKSPQEIAVIREATRLAGLGIMEAMRDAKPGMREYELEAAAEYVYKRGGAYGESYFPLIANGPNMIYTHYHKNEALLKDGDLVQFDWAPDINNYTTDVTRVFPANGKFTPAQRKFYGIYLALYKAELASIKPHKTAREILDSTLVKWDKIMAEYKFTDPKIKAAAQAWVDRTRPNPNGRGGGGGGSLGHSVGMEVHDVRNITTTLEPGYIFTIEPQLIVPGTGLSIRLEDMILITETGVEILSSFVPIEMADIEKLMAQPGLGERSLIGCPKCPKQ